MKKGMARNVRGETARRNAIMTAEWRECSAEHENTLPHLIFIIAIL